MIARPINTKAIIRALLQIGLGVVPHENELPVNASQGTNGWMGFKIYSGPTQTQITTAGTPYFAVNRPECVGYAIGGQLVSMDVARGIQSTEPVWDFEVYAFHPYDENNPNYDDATDDMNDLWQTYMLNPRLPFTTTIQAGATNTSIPVAIGDGRRFMAYDVMYINGVPTPPILPISGDTITFASPLPFVPAAGTQASQATCANSYPHSMRPDYAQLRDGGPWCVGTLTVRAFENLVTDFNAAPQ